MKRLRAAASALAATVDDVAEVLFMLIVGLVLEGFWVVLALALGCWLVSHPIH